MLVRRRIQLWSFTKYVIHLKLWMWRNKKWTHRQDMQHVWDMRNAWYLMEWEHQEEMECQVWVKIAGSPIGDNQSSRETPPSSGIPITYNSFQCYQLCLGYPSGILPATDCNKLFTHRISYFLHDSHKNHPSHLPRFDHFTNITRRIHRPYIYQLFYAGKNVTKQYKILLNLQL